MPDADVPDAAPKGLDRETRRVVAIAVAASSIGWWPAFTLGVYGVIFFEQHLALWAAATSAFIAVELGGGRRVLRRVSNYTLLLPSLWLVLIWLLPVTDSTARYVLFWFGVVVTLLGLPALAAFLVRLLVPGAEKPSTQASGDRDHRGRDRHGRGVRRGDAAPAHAQLRRLLHQRQLRARELQPRHRHHGERHPLNSPRVCTSA